MLSPIQKGNSKHSKFRKKLNFRKDEKDLRKLAEGITGIPFIDTIKSYPGIEI